VKVKELGLHRERRKTRAAQVEFSDGLATLQANYGLTISDWPNPSNSGAAQTSVEF
jgi:hypothetical protein